MQFRGCVEGLNDIKIKHFFFDWIADLESFLSMQKYSQFASKKASTQTTQNRLTCGPSTWDATQVGCDGFCLCGLLGLAIWSPFNCLWTCLEHRKLLGRDLHHMPT